MSLNSVSDYQVKKCNCCNKILTLDNFGQKKRGYLGVKAQCKSCLSSLERKRRIEDPNYKERHKELTNQWRHENRERWREINLKNTEARRLQKARRYAYKLALPNSFTIEEFELIRTKEYSKETFEIDHFIPLAWGHGGTYVENLCVLPKLMNTRKKDNNPFEFRKTLTKDERLYFDKIIKRIANQYNISVRELRQYVYWCEQNKRTPEDIKRDGNTNSFELWGSQRVRCMN